MALICGDERRIPQTLACTSVVLSDGDRLGYDPSLLIDHSLN